MIIQVIIGSIIGCFAYNILKELIIKKGKK